MNAVVPFRTYWKRASVLLFGLALLSAAPAVATPATVYFNGPNVGGSNFGISETSALAASLAGGIPIISPPVFDVDGSLGIGSQTLMPLTFGVTLFPFASYITSSWTMNNLRDDGQLSNQEVYLLFATPVPYDVSVGGSPVTISYPPENVGLTIDGLAPNGDRWAIIEVFDEDLGQTFYYPGVSLGTLADLSSSDPFNINYVVRGEYLDEGIPGQLGLPQFQVLMAIVPEPGTGLLLGLGLIALSAARRRSACS